MKISRTITRRNPPTPGAAPTAVGEWPLKISIVFDESANAEGTEVTIRYATSDFACDLGLPDWEELDPLEPDMASAGNASDTDS